MTLQNCLGSPLLGHFALDPTMCTCTRDSPRRGVKPVALLGYVAARQSSWVGKKVEGEEHLLDKVGSPALRTAVQSTCQCLSVATLSSHSDQEILEQEKFLFEISLRAIFLLSPVTGHRTLALCGTFIYVPCDFKDLGTWQWPGFLLFSYCGKLQLRLLWFFCKFWVCFADKRFVARGI